jgi:hypothetical protein
MQNVEALLGSLASVSGRAEGHRELQGECLVRLNLLPYIAFLSGSPGNERANRARNCVFP